MTSTPDEFYIGSDSDLEHAEILCAYLGRCAPAVSAHSLLDALPRRDFESPNASLELEKEAVVLIQRF